MAKEVTMPRLSETMNDGKILTWHKKVGDKVNNGDILAEVETDKANMEVEAVDSGTLSKIFIREGEIAKVGEPIAILDGQAKTKPKEQPAQPVKDKIPNQPQEKQTEPDQFQFKPANEEQEAIKQEKPVEIDIKLKATPLARKIASEKCIDLSKIQGSGPGGRIIEKDVENYSKASLSSKETVQKNKLPQEETVKEAKQNAQPEKKTKIISLSRMKKTIADRMVESKTSAPHFYVTFEVYTDTLVQFYQDIREKFEDKLTLNDIFIKACAINLKKFPVFNSHFKDYQIEFYENINIGIAYAVNEGLLVPVIHDCDKKSLKEISLKTRELKSKVKTNKLLLEDMSGATFSISNMGMYGVKEFSAIINPPEAAGLAIGAVLNSPIIKDNQVVVGSCVNLTLSADHRIVNGAEAAMFLKSLKEILENPSQIGTN